MITLCAMDVRGAADHRSSIGRKQSVHPSVDKNKTQVNASNAGDGRLALSRFPLSSAG
jgi:hypothetical protein